MTRLRLHSVRLTQEAELQWEAIVDGVMQSLYNPHACCNLTPVATIYVPRGTWSPRSKAAHCLPIEVFKMPHFPLVTWQPTLKFERNFLLFLSITAILQLVSSGQFILST